MIHVVCDDSKTAAAYLALLARELQQHVTIRVHAVKCSESAPDAAFEQAKRIREKATEQDAVEQDDQFWLLLDLEETPDQNNRAEAAAKQAEENGIKVARSKPCFELWTLLHLLDTGEHFQNCDAVLRRLGSEWEKAFGSAMPKKARVDYSKLLEHRKEATERARSHHTNEDPSWTEIYKLLEAIDAIVAKHTPESE